MWPKWLRKFPLPIPAGVQDFPILAREVNRMQRSLPNECPRHKTRWPLAAASAAVVAALAGTVYFGIPQYSVQAQQRPDSVATPFGRAPLSFADIVDRVKPAVVSIQVSAGGPAAVAQNEPKRGGAPSDKFNRGGKGGGGK